MGGSKIVVLGQPICVCDDGDVLTLKGDVLDVAVVDGLDRAVGVAKLAHLQSKPSRSTARAGKAHRVSEDRTKNSDGWVEIIGYTGWG